MPVRPVPPGVDRFRQCLISSLCLCICLWLCGCNFSSDSGNRALGSGSGSGGGSGSSSSSGSASPGAPGGVEKTGKFIAGGIQGLHYETPSFSGLTNRNGRFRYREGETVTFSLGGILLGSASGAPKLNPFDLVGSSPLRDELALRAALEDHQRVDALDLVANMMLLFLTLDRDQNPENGIDLTDWNRDLADYRLDFAFDLYGFPARRGLDSLSAIKTAFAIQYQLPLSEPLLYLYDALGVEVPVHVPVRETRDIEDNGSIEQEVLLVYNDFGLPAELRLFFLPDTAQSWRERLTFDYDDRARLVFSLRESDIDENGVVNFFYRSERLFNGQGFLVEIVEEDGVLVVNERRIYRFDYDDGSNRVLFTFEQDDDVDGIVDAIFRSERFFSDDGLLELQQDESDLNADGRVEIRRSFSFRYTSAGLLLEQIDTEDNGDTTPADGVVDKRTEIDFRHDSRERLIRETQRIDDNGDGVVDRENTYRFTYLSNDLLREQVWEFDVDADGTPDVRRRFEYRYNSHENLLRREMQLDTDADGRPEAREVVEYRYTSNQQLRETEITTYNSSDEVQGVLTFTRTYGRDGELRDWYREGEGATGIVNTPIRLRWQYADMKDGLRYLIEHFRFRQPAYPQEGVSDLNQPCLEYRFAAENTVCAAEFWDTQIWFENPRYWGLPW
ncbi:hypothetical protein PVT68_08595 [Microbulbifer bruguierae]|uniref:YD repeat-containing protein n=1 Tax=Microbulbifer bruguierae TaxID=3029061 RepID=A0ABY8NJ21_9GAMM|nr:hypothetical protein [Microbulbifer bruguierae]WGL18339.1 hypothetical protein PVT68_08595 [Microbulbifer bruguierae]